MERPFDTVLGQVFGTLEKTERNFIFNFNQNDKILVWIVGFSITAITLIITKITDLSKTYSNGILKTALLLLIIVVISGVIYRFSALLFLTKYQNKIFFLEGAFSKEKIMPTEINELKQDFDIFQIHQKIKSDFDFDYSDIIDLFNASKTEESKKYYTNYLREEYLRIGEWAKTDYENSINYIKGVYKNTFGLSKKSIDKIFKGKNETFYFKLYAWVSVLSSFICVISFLSVLILLAVNYN